MQWMNACRMVIRSLALAARFVVVLCGFGAMPLAEASDPAVRTDAILVNHVGFLPDSPKYCVIPQPPEKTFSIHRLKDCVWTQAHQGTLTEGGPELEAGWVGEFTSLQEEGIYQVRCGARQSRCFVVWSRVYDAPMRVLYNYFPWQRCGDSLTGWAAPCHVDDGRIAETGEHQDLSGGFHQSCDLRKWASVEVIGLMGLNRFGQIQSPRWDNGRVAEDLRWGGDYYQKLVREDGGMLDSVFIPLGWGPRDFYLSDAPPPAMWSNIRYQAMLATYFKSREAAYAEKCEQTAMKVWRYMTSTERGPERYHAPALPPRGHDALDSWYTGFYPGSSLGLAHRLCAAVAPLPCYRRPWPAGRCRAVRVGTRGPPSGARYCQRQAAMLASGRVRNARAW